MAHNKPLIQQYLYFIENTFRTLEYRGRGTGQAICEEVLQFKYPETVIDVWAHARRFERLLDPGHPTPIRKLLEKLRRKCSHFRQGAGMQLRTKGVSLNELQEGILVWGKEGMSLFNAFLKGEDTCR